jgi:hypothetical protein
LIAAASDGHYRVVPFDESDDSYGGPSNVISKGIGGTPTSLGGFASLGPGGGGASYSAAFHNTNSDVFLVGQDVGGIFKTTDGGQTFRHVNSGITGPDFTTSTYGISGIFADPLDDAVFYAAAWNGLFRSADTGETWTAVAPALPWNPAAGDVPFDCVASSALDPNLVVAGTGDWHYPDTGQGVYRSTNNGTSFELADAVGINEDAVISSLAFDPETGELYAATSAGLFKSSDNGDTFTPVGGPFAHDHGHWISITGTGSAKNFWYILHVLGDDGDVANWSGGIYRSTDGISWTEVPGIPKEIEVGGGGAASASGGGAASAGQLDSVPEFANARIPRRSMEIRRRVDGPDFRLG